MRQGVTLIEILVSTLILSFLIAGIFSILVIQDKTYNEEMSLVYLQQQARISMQGMTREIRQTKQSDIVITSPGPLSGQVIRFKIPNETYCLRYSLNNNKVIREIIDCSLGTALQQRTLANNVNSLNFSLLSNSVEIKFRLTKSVRGRTLCFPVDCNSGQFLTELVKLRN